MTRLAIAIAASLAIASIATLAIHTRARDAWQRERDRLGTEGYDASRSDAAWDEARAWQTIADRVALAGAAALVIASALASASTREPASAPEPTSTGAPAAARLLASTMLDAVAVAAWIPATRAIPTEGALADALGWWLPALALASHAALLARGATVGMRLTRVRIAPAPWWRVLLATALTPLALSSLPVGLPALALGARSARWLAPHLALAGLRVAS